MKRVFFCLVFAFFLIVSGEVQAQDTHFRRHYIIVVDQGACHVHENMPKLYRCVKNLFETGNLEGLSGLTNQSYSTDYSFDPLCDEISIYASGVTETSYSDIVNHAMSGNISPEEMNNKILEALFRQRKSFQSCRAESELDVASYFQENLKPLMSGYSGNVRVGLNAFLYPLILGRLKVDVPAESYYIIRVSNFTSQGEAKSVWETQLKPLLAQRQNYIAGFDSYINSLNSLYLKQGCLNIVHKVSGGMNNVNNVNNNPIVVGDKLVLASLVGVGLNNMSSPSFRQKTYGKNNFAFTPATVVFPHDDHLLINKVYLDVSGRHVDMTKKYKYNKATSEYCFPKGDVKIDSVRTGDILNPHFVFVAQTFDDNGNSLLPMVFKSNCQYQLSSSDFATAPNSYLILICVLLAVAFLIFVAKKIWEKRGRDRSAWVNFKIHPVSRSRFMEVKDIKVVNEDCWYMGPDNQNQRITVEGDLVKEAVPFCKNYYYRLEYCVIDEDSENDFTFRPDGIDAQGQNKLSEKWYKADVQENGHFKINILTYLDLEHSPHLKDPEKLQELFADKDHPYRLLRMHIKFRILVLDPKEKRVDIEAIQIPDFIQVASLCVREKQYPMPGKMDPKFERAYDFIVKPDFERKTAWVAFDPGTTGSCAAFSFSGNPWDSITLAKNQFSVTDDEAKKTTCIFPSVVKVEERARCFRQDGADVSNVEQWDLDQDFISGNKADQRLGNNRFKSIKKLLGYTNLLTLKKDAVEKKISGKDLAFLLVKGLYKGVSDYAMGNPEVDDYLRQNMSNESGTFAPTRAIVAVPNNYTLLKIQDMVDSVKRLDCFEEVHYLYESEGVMMNYLNKMWTKLSREDNNKLFLVYDMGGATINATAFQIENEFNKDNNNIEQITVKTVSKVGYCVGGDDIDYALIRILFDLPAVSAKLNNDAARKNDMMNQNKQKLIKFVTELKLDLIGRAKGDDASRRFHLQNDEVFVNAVCSIMKDCGLSGLYATDFGEDDKKFIKEQLYQQNHPSRLMYKYVYSKVEDAVKELILDLDASNVELIFSGRSSLYPHIQDYVKETMKKEGYTFTVWDGFNDENGYLDADAVKTAVAAGACWYAAFNTKIRLDHSVIPSTFGYIDQENGRPKFVPVIKRLDKYQDGKKTGSSIPIDKSLSKIVFLQMLGADYDKILDDFYNQKKNLHKINVLDEVPGVILDGAIDTISITVEDNNNFEYDVETSVKQITPKSNRYSRISGHEGTAVKTEIVDENNESYVFAALQTVDEKFGQNASGRRSI